jgi:hypothetical protein
LYFSWPSEYIVYRPKVSAETTLERKIIYMYRVDFLQFTYWKAIESVNRRQHWKRKTKVIEKKTFFIFYSKFFFYILKNWALSHTKKNKCKKNSIA